LLFQTTDGKKVLDVQYGDAPLQSSNISPDGKHLLATRGDKGVGVWEIATQQEVFVHNLLGGATSVLATSGEAPKVVAVQPNGTVSEFPLLGGQGGTWDWRKKYATSGATQSATMRLAASADGETICVFDPCTPGNLHLTFAEGRYCSVYVDTAGGGPVAVGKHVVADTLTPGRFRLVIPAADHTSVRSRAIRLNSWGARALSVAPDDLYAANISLDKEQIHFVSCRTGIRKSGPIPPTPRGYLAAVNWPTATIVTADHQGGINLLRFSQHSSPAEQIVQEVDRCLAEKDDERLEQIAAELEQETTNFSFDGIDDTKYSRFIQTLMGSADVTRSAARTARYEEWLKRNPDSQLTRICRATQLIADAWEARGSGYADTVSPEGWRIFDQKTAEAGAILEPFAQGERIPGEAYALIFSVAKAQNWPEEKTAAYVERFLREAPHNVRAHGSRIHGLLPRWGGAPHDCRDYAERVAAQIGGAEGDAMYAAMVVYLMNIADHGIAGQLGFDSKRFQAGLDHRFRDDPENAHYWQLAVMLAAIAGDKQRGHEFAMKIAMRRDPYAGLYCNETIFDELIKAAWQFKPGR
jgi:hypothetical protein